MSRQDSPGGRHAKQSTETGNQVAGERTDGRTAPLALESPHHIKKVGEVVPSRSLHAPWIQHLCLGQAATIPCPGLVCARDGAPQVLPYVNNVRHEPLNAHVCGDGPLSDEEVVNVTPVGASAKRRSSTAVSWLCLSSRASHNV